MNKQPAQVRLFIFSSTDQDAKLADKLTWVTIISLLHFFFFLFFSFDQYLVV